MTLARQVAWNTTVQVIGRTISIVLSLILIKYLTGYLRASGYGDYTTAINFVAIFAIIADFGLNNIVVRELSRRKEGVKEYVSQVLGLRALFALLTLALAPLAALILPYSHSVLMAVLIVALASYMLSLNQVFVGVFQANLRMERAVLTEIVGRIVIFVGSLLFIHWQMGLLPIIGVIFLGHLTNVTLSWLLARKFVKPTISFNLTAWRRLFWEMLPMGTVIVLGMLYVRSDVIVLSVLKDSQAVGIYGVAFKFFDILIALPAFFMGAVFPFLARFYHEDKSRFLAILEKAEEILALTALPIATSFIVLAVPFIRLVATSEFLPAALVLQLFSIGLVFSFLASMPYFALIAMNRQRALIWVYGFLIVENVIFNIIFVPRYSYNATAAVSALTQFLAFVGSWWLLYRFSGFKPKIGNFGKIIVGTLLFGGVLWCLKDTLILALVAGIAVYALAMLVFKVVDKDMIKSILGKQAS